jgi:type VII secretion protein EccB
MASRLDELHGHQYATQRMVNALTRHNPDPLDRSPRTRTLTLVGAMLAALLAVGVLVFNVFTGHGGPSELRDSSTVLIEKESGAHFVYTKADDRLHPVLNYASGLLLAEGSGEATVVRRKSLAALRSAKGVQIGPTLGIPDAPNAVPRRSDLIRDAWQVCTRSAAGEAPHAELFVGANTVSGGQALTLPRPGDPGESLLVQGPDERVFLVFANRKFLLPKPAVVLAAFGWTGRPRQPVSAGWLNALPSGPDVSTPSIAGLGEPSSVVQDTIGRIYEAPGTSGDQWAVVQRDRVQPISDVQARLLQADPQVDAGDPVKVTTAFFATLPSIGAPSADSAQDGLPTVVPALLSIESTACVRVPDAATGVTAVTVGAALPSAAPVAPSAAPESSSGADFVSVPFGHGVLVRAAASDTAPADSGTVSILTDSGIRYPIADADAMTRLGFEGAPALAMPGALVAMLPVGPSLSTATATHSW